MSTDAALEEHAIDTLLAWAVEWSGHQAEGVPREAVRRALRRELASGASVAEVMNRAAARDPALVRTLRVAIGVRETFFFRHPDQFDLIATRAPALAREGVVRAWSAGCATGEETWSLAATLAASVFPSEASGAPRLAILGTDLYEPALEVARAGIYKTTSIRPSGPLMFSVLAPVRDRFEVLEPLRRITSFVVHDLCEPQPGQFELIMCRNVLVYFARPAARSVLRHLADALVTDGLLVFGTMDLEAAELPGLVRVGRPELMAFTKPAAQVRRRRPTTRKQAAPNSPTLPSEAIALHRSALVWIELGGRGSAEKVLADLNQRYPDYLPGMLERALLHVRKGEHATAMVWMKEVLRRAEALPSELTVAGLEALPASFYRDTARSFIDRSSDAAGER